MTNLALSLSRYYTPNATLGELAVRAANDYSRVLFSCYTIERPWRDNQVGESCIPEGTYTLALRYSPVVKRTTGGEFEHGWEVTDVPGGRTYIMIHPANWSDQVEGCIAVGREIPTRQMMVSHSLATFRKLMDAMPGEGECLLLISQKAINARA